MQFWCPSHHPMVFVCCLGPIHELRKAHPWDFRACILNCVNLLSSRDFPGPLIKASVYGQVGQTTMDSRKYHNPMPEARNNALRCFSSSWLLLSCLDWWNLSQNVQWNAPGGDAWVFFGSHLAPFGHLVGPLWPSCGPCGAPEGALGYLNMVSSRFFHNGNSFANHIHYVLDIVVRNPAHPPSDSPVGPAMPRCRLHHRGSSENCQK